MLILLLSASVVVSYSYIIPRPQWVNLGNASQFSAARPTRVAFNPVNVWVVNTGEEFVVLHSVPNDTSRCRINWEEERQRIADPCRGTVYTNTGMYIEGPPPERGSDRYSVRIDARGDLYIELSKPILGLSFEQMKDACMAQMPPRARFPDYNWMQYCNLELIGLEQAEGR